MRTVSFYTERDKQTNKQTSGLQRRVGGERRSLRELEFSLPSKKKRLNTGKVKTECLVFKIPLFIPLKTTNVSRLTFDTDCCVYKENGAPFFVSSLKFVKLLFLFS